MGTEQLLRPGAGRRWSLAWRGVTNRNLSYTWPNVQPGQDDNMQAAGQALAVPDASTLDFLGAATNGPSTSEVALVYTDGSAATTSLSFSDWTLNAGSASPVTGNDIVASMPYRNAATLGGAQ